MSNQNYSIKKDLKGTSLLNLETISLNDRKQVTQATSKATGVTINAKVGEIILDATALAGDATESFTVTNSKVNANSIILLQVAGETSNTDGSIEASVTSRTNGSFVIRMTNTDNGNVTAGKIMFLVLN